MAEFKLEPEVERRGVLSLTKSEAKVLIKLLGNLSFNAAEKELDMTNEEYVISCNIYNAIDDEGE